MYQLNDIVLVAIFEEIIFRGFLWKLALQLPTMLLTVSAWILSVLLFGASHLTLGKGQFISKSLLGIFCMLSVIFWPRSKSLIKVNRQFSSALPASCTLDAIGTADLGSVAAVRIESGAGTPYQGR